MEGSFSAGGTLKNPPEDAYSILRGGPEADFLRLRMERPARFGRVILPFLGVVTASAGLTMRIATGSSLGFALGAFGIVLIVLGVVQHLLYRRDQAHWPDQAFLWEDGLELVLRNGEVRGASWSDPDLALHLIARRAPAPANREYLLIWLMESSIPPVELSAEGFDRLRKMAANHGLESTQVQRGRRADSTQLIEIHPSSAAAAAAMAKPAEASGPG